MASVEQFALLYVDGSEQDLCEPLLQQLGVRAGRFIVKGVEPGAEQEQAEVVVDL